MPVRTLKRHDTKVTPWARFLDEAGAPIDLTGCTVVYTLQDQATQLNVITRASATIRTQATWPGEVFYQFLPSEVADVLMGSEEWEVSYPGGLKESFPVGDMVQVIIEPDLDNV